MRLIDADATFELLRSLGSRDYRREKGTIMDAMKMISHPEYTPTVDAVPRGVHEQVRWERDVAIGQLEEHGIPFCGIAPDVVKVVRCKDCKHYDNTEGIQWCHLNSKFAKWGTDWHSFPEDGFCSYGERKDND